MKALCLMLFVIGLLDCFAALPFLGPHRGKLLSDAGNALSPIAARARLFRRQPPPHPT